jgi:phage-related protein
VAGFGGAVKLTGESNYRKALKQITLDLKEVDSELKVVSSQYDKNDKSQEALTAQSEALTKKLEAQAKKVGVLKDNYSAMSRQAEENKSKHEALKNELDNAVKELAKIEQESGKTSKAYELQAGYVAGLTQDYNKSAKAIDEQDQALSKARTDINKAKTDYNNTQKALDSLDKTTEDTSKSTEKLGKDTKTSGDEANKAAKGGFTVLKGALANLAAEAIKAIPTALINGLKDLGSSFAKAAVDVAKFGDEIGKGADKANMSVEGYQEWSYILDRTGGSIDGVKNAMLKLEQASESGSAAFDELGISQERLAEMSPEETFNATIEALQNVEDEGRRTVLAAQLLGKSFGTDLGNLLEQSAEDTDALRGKVHDLGLVMSGDAVDNAETFKDTLGDLKGSLTGLKNNLISEFLPSLTTVMSGLTDVFSNKDAEGGLKKISQGVDDFSKQLVTIAPRFLSLASGIITNLLGALAKIAPELIKTIGQVINNTLPIISTLLKEGLPVLIGAIESTIKALGELLPEILPILFDAVGLLVTDLCAWLSEEGNVSALLQGIFELTLQLTEQIANLLPIILPAVFQVIAEIVDFLTKPENIMMFTESVLYTVGAIVVALVNSLPNILNILKNLGYNIVSGAVKLGSKVKEWLSGLVSNVKTNISNWLNSVKTTLNNAKTNFLNGVNNVKTKIAEFVSNIFGKIKELPSKVVSIGKDLVNGLWNGIKEKMSYLKNKISEFGQEITAKIKSVFGISSPSKVTKRLGGYLAEGLGDGFTEGMRDVNREINAALPDFSELETKTGATATATTGGLDYYTLVNAFKEALTSVDVELDDVKVGKFVKKTVTNAIYT